MTKCGKWKIAAFAFFVLCAILTVCTFFSVPGITWNPHEGSRYLMNEAPPSAKASHCMANCCDYIAMHDVDLLPLNPDLDYTYPYSGCYHVASPEYHPKYSYPTYLGGILIITRYWGWGLEDDEFYLRLKEAGISISRPRNLLTGKKDTFRHLHANTILRKRDNVRCFNQSVVSRKHDKVTGLSNIEYHIVASHHISIDNAQAVVYNVKLKCDKKGTPWCNCETAPPKMC